MKLFFPNFFRRREKASPESHDHDEGSSPTKIWKEVVGKAGKRSGKSLSGGFGPKRVRFNEGVAQIGVELENGRRLYYMIHGENGVERLDEERTDRVPLLSAFCDDARVFSQNAMSDAKAKGFAARETDALERMAVINESKRSRIYATPHSSIEDGMLRIPFLEVIDDLLDGKKGSFVAGVMIGAQDLVVMYAYNEGVMGRQQLQVAINPENLDGIANSFLSMSGLPDDSEIIIFDQDEFLQKLRSRSWTPYPSTQGFYGIPARHIPVIMVGAAGIAAVGASIYAGYWYLQERHFVELTAKHEQKKNDVIANIGGEILTRRHAFMLKTSLDIEHAAKLASGLRTEGSLVEANLRRDSYVYTVITPFFNPDSAGNGEAYRNAIALEPEEGCSKRGIETTGGMREIKVQYSCTNSGANFARFGW